MTHPIVALQGALVAALRADATLAGLIGQAVFDAPPRGQVWVDAAVLDALELKPGDALLLGDTSLAVGGVIASEPDRGAGFMSFAPRVMLNEDDLPATGLIQPASRVSYRLLLAGAQSARFVEQAGPLIEQGHYRGLRLESLEGGRPEMRQTLDRATQFLRELESDLPAHTRDDIAAAFRELLMNAIEHGGHSDPRKRVRVSILRTGRSLIVHVVDPGSGFSLDTLPHAAISNPDDSPTRHAEVRAESGRRPGGFGILMTRSLVDELLYNERGNAVLFVKYLS